MIFRVLENRSGTIICANEIITHVLSIIEKNPEYSETIAEYYQYIFTKEEFKPWTGLLMYHACHTYFVAENIGLGYMELFDQDRSVP